VARFFVATLSPVAQAIFPQPTFASVFTTKPKFMKRKFMMSLVIASFLVVHGAGASSLPFITAPTSVVIKSPDPLAAMTAKQFLELTPQKFHILTGKKMNLVQKMQLKFVQYKVRRMVRKGQVVTMADVKKKFDDLNSMNVLGLLLGLVLGPVGVVIALILKETGDVGPDVVRWSLYGLLIWLAIVLVAILL
jgi:hypothetical protein